VRNTRPRTLLCSFVLVLLMLTARGVQSGSAFATPAPTPADSPKPAEATIIATYTLPEIALGPFQNTVLPNSIANDRKLQVGAIGSDMWHGPNDPPNEFWLVSDRGPNGQGTVGSQRRRTFPTPEFSPVILRVQTQGDSINVLQSIPILTQSGKPVTGLPNTDGRDEVPYDYSAQTRLNYNPNGLDIEGLVRTSAGDFWLCEEYSPSIVHVDRTGKVLKRYIPEGLQLDGVDYAMAPVLPAIYAKRKINRGFEGMTISADEKTLYLVLQSPLYNPDKKTGDASRHTRLLVFDIASEKPIAEYVYRFEAIKDFAADPKLGPDEMKLSAVALVNATTLLIVERTDTVAKLYSVDIGKATNILGSPRDDAATTPSLEALDDLAASSVVVLPKILVADLSKLPGVPDKVEGLVVLDRLTVAIVSDNDFDIGKFDDNGNNVGQGVKTKIVVIGLPRPLP
jgi:Esterase-like activity of phytase